MNALCDPSSCYEKMRCLFHNREKLAPASECNPVLSRGDGFSVIVRAAFLCTVVFLCRFCWTWFNTSCSNFSIKGICRSIASRHLPQESEIGSFSMRPPTPFFLNALLMFLCLSGNSIRKAILREATVTTIDSPLIKTQRQL